MLHQLHNPLTFPLGLDLLNHIRHLLQHQSPFQIRMSRPETQQIVSCTTSNIHYQHLVITRIPKAFAHWISALVRPHGFAARLHGHHAAEAGTLGRILRKVFEESGVGRVPGGGGGRVAGVGGVLEGVGGEPGGGGGPDLVVVVGPEECWLVSALALLGWESRELARTCI
jgi:hypothetical protein